MSDTAQSTTPTDPGQGTAPAAPTTEPVAPLAATEPSAPAPADGGVQPAATDATTQPDGGQGLIAPYLEGVEEAHRDIVSTVLEKYRQDSDAQITKRFEELNGFKQYAENPEALQAPVYLYDRLMEEPLETIQWVVDRFQAEAGVDLKSQLLQALGQEEAPAPTTDPQAPAEDDPNRPMTVAEWQKLQQEQAAAQAQEQQANERRELAKSWFDEAAGKHGLELDGETDVAVRHAILTHASQLLPKLQHLGPDAGKSAITTAVEAFVNRYGKGTPPAADPSTPEPRVADGGTPPAPAEVTELPDAKSRKAFMLSLLQGSSSQE